MYCAFVAFSSPPQTEGSDNLVVHRLLFVTLIIKTPCIDEQDWMPRKIQYLIRRGQIFFSIWFFNYLCSLKSNFLIAG